MSRHTLVAALVAAGVAAGVAGVAGLSACTIEPPAATATPHLAVADANASAAINQDLAALRGALAPYHRIEMATAADVPS